VYCVCWKSFFFNVNTGHTTLCLFVAMGVVDTAWAALDVKLVVTFGVFFLCFFLLHFCYIFVLFFYVFLKRFVVVPVCVGVCGMWMCGGCDTVQLWHIFSGVRDRYEANRSYYRQLLEHNESKETPFAAEIEQVTWCCW